MEVVAKDKNEDAVSKLAVDVERKCSTDETAATPGGEVGHQTPVTAEHDGTAKTSEPAAQTTVAGSDAGKVATDSEEPAEQRVEKANEPEEEKRSSEEVTKPRNNDEDEDPEVSFKKQANQHGTEEQAGVDSKKDSHDVNRNSQEEISSKIDKSACCSA